MITKSEYNCFQIPDNFQKYITMLLSLLLVLGIVAVFWPVQNYEFLNYDDQIYVTGNLRVRSGLTWDNFLWAIRSLDAGFWQPLTWLSLMADSSLYRMNAGGFHWTNVILHIGSTLLLFSVLYRMTGAAFRSFFVAALFAIHPLHVESVAWIAERKDVLSGFFWMLTMLVYVRYAEKPGIKLYAWVLLCFISGLMAKPMLMTLPVVLLLLDYWPLGRFHAAVNRRKVYGLLIMEKIPLLICASIACILTFIAEYKFDAISNLETIPLAARISNVLASYIIYMEKMVFPANLAAYYPHPGAWPLEISLGAGLLIVIFSLIAINKLGSKPYLFVGWFWYLITLIPVIGFIQLGSMARADRYTYLPLIGIFISVAWFFADLFNKRKALLSSLAVAVVIVFIVCSGFQIQYWRNDFTLFQHAIAVTENNYKAYHGLGMAYYRLGNRSQAVEHIRHSLMLKNNDRARNDLGFIYMGQGAVADAEREFREAIRLKHNNANAHYNLGIALAVSGKYEEANQQFQEVLRLDPNNKNAQKNLLQVPQNH